MLGENDFDIFLNNDHFSEDVTVPDGSTIKGIFDYMDDVQFAGLAEGRDPSILVHINDYSAKGLKHHDTLILKTKSYRIESIGPYGADREYMVIGLKEL